MEKKWQKASAKAHVESHRTSRASRPDTRSLGKDSVASEGAGGALRHCSSVMAPLTVRGMMKRCANALPARHLSLIIRSHLLVSMLVASLALPTRHLPVSLEP